MKDALLAELEAFEIDEPVAFPFSARLARENGWSHDHSRRVIAEYKRFVWLAVRAGQAARAHRRCARAAARRCTCGEPTHAPATAERDAA
jgi:hypothetical protein